MQESYLFVCQVAGLGAHGIIPYLTKFVSQLPAQLFSVESMRHCVLHYQSIWVSTSHQSISNAEPLVRIGFSA